MKTKPTQHSVKELRSIGIQPNMLVVRTEKPITEDMKKKIALFTDVPENAVIESRDAKTLYSIPLALQAQGMDQIVVDHFGFDVPDADMRAWTQLEHKVQHLTHTTKIALVGKYVALKDAYISVAEALKHAGYYWDSDIDLQMFQAEDVNDDNVESLLQGFDGILVPGGFGDRGLKAKLPRFAMLGKMIFHSLAFA